MRVYSPPEFVYPISVMTTDNDELVKVAIELGAARAVIVDTSRIEFHEEFRQACERNVCGKYATSWMGPPAIGPIGELMERARRYKKGLFFQTVHPLARSFDMKGIEAAVLVYRQVLGNLVEMLRDSRGPGEVLPLGAGCCGICPKCAFLDNEPCRHPDQAVSSLEAYGMDVMALARDLDMPYNSGPKTVSFFGLILFNDEEA